MLLKHKKVAIIGAGPVGLTMATLLQQKGVNVSVYERDRDATTRISGGTLDLHKGTGQDALEVLGLLDTYYKLALPMGRVIADEQGNVLFSKSLSFEELQDAPEINRNDLKKMLLNSLNDDTVIWDHKFTGLEVRNGQWLLHFENEPSVTADLVIGANGGMSKVRPYVTDAAIEYTGTLMLQGEVPHAETNCQKFYQLCNDKILMTANGGNLLVANPRNGGILSYNIIFKQPDDWEQQFGSTLPDTAKIVTFLSDKLAHWHKNYHELLRATSSFVVWRTRKISLEIPWKSNRPLPITLIGDAAHIMPPFAGQGVNIGMKDALILSDNLTNGNYDTIEAAINDYELQMLVYASEAQLQTSINEKEMVHDPEFSFRKFYK